MMKKILIVFSILWFSIFCHITAAAEEELLAGKTMGTTYHIKIITGKNNPPKDLHKKIKQLLHIINQSMSTYQKNSEINRFNTNRTSAPFKASKGLLFIMNTGRMLYKITDGAWDCTINPVVNLWGFGSKTEKQKVPSKAEIQSRLTETGFHNIQVNNNTLVKKKPSITIDLASIAKGYAVDQVSAFLKEKGINSFLVEIGGEVYASGSKSDGSPWKVGINTPEKNGAFDQVYLALPVKDMAFATSGDYRIFFKEKGRYYSHIIDPKTGYPVNNGVVSVSITAESCAFADGLATAVMVMGHKKGIDLINKLPGVECLIIVQDKDDKLLDHASKGFKQLLKKN